MAQMKLSLLLAASTVFGFLLGFATVGLASWVESPPPTDPNYEEARHYTEPVCPPGLEPSFFAVVVLDTESRPIYLCLKPGLGGNSEKVGWEDAAVTTTDKP